MMAWIRLCPLMNDSSRGSWNISCVAVQVSTQASTLQAPDADDLGNAPQAAHDLRQMQAVGHLEGEVDDGVGAGIAGLKADVVDIRAGLGDHRGDFGQHAT